MGYRPVCVTGDPLEYFLQENDEESRMRIADVVVRENKSATELFSHVIRLATDSPWIRLLESTNRVTKKR